MMDVGLIDRCWHTWWWNLIQHYFSSSREFADQGTSVYEGLLTEMLSLLCASKKSWRNGRMQLKSDLLPATRYRSDVWKIDKITVKWNGLHIKWHVIGQDLISPLTHWRRVRHICVNKLTIIGSDNGLSPGRRQAIIWTNAGILLIRNLGTNFSEIIGEIHSFSFSKLHLKMSSAKWHLFGLGLNELNDVLWSTNGIRKHR